MDADKLKLKQRDPFLVSFGSPQKRNFSRAITPCFAHPARISKSLAVSRTGVKVLVALYRNSAVRVHKYERSACVTASPPPSRSQ
ncbi:hypothetical protein QQF64_021695 [Cirrhinus molitorella]|uniref:Uncharacterized protein n=1 Tax=Cirrhinus molitorella TaxID=172907 RepID=A0ABR3L6C2_9TELE